MTDKKAEWFITVCEECNSSSIELVDSFCLDCDKSVNLITMRVVEAKDEKEEYKR